MSSPRRRERAKRSVSLSQPAAGGEAEAFVQHAPRPQADRTERRLRPACVAEDRLLGWWLMRVEGGWRIDEVREPLWLGGIAADPSDGIVRGREGVEHFGEQACRFPQHTNVLRTLPGE
jgi:hypothetical protein